jgi:chromosome segregation ATPase
MKTLCLMLLLALAPAAAQAAYKCVDEKGRTHFGDTPPPGCANVVLYEVTASGKVIRRLEPSLTEDQAKAKAEAEQSRRESDRLAALQKRKDMALLATYSSEEEFDVVRERNVAPVQGRIRSVQERLAAVDKRIAKLDEEMEFYKAGKSKSAKQVSPPAPLLAELERLAQEKSTLNRSIANYEKEIVELRARFDTDKRRWVAIKTGGAGAQAQSVPTSAAGKSN